MQTRNKLPLSRIFQYADYIFTVGGDSKFMPLSASLGPNCGIHEELLQTRPISLIFLDDRRMVKLCKNNNNKEVI
jgi:hypothetical protein